MRSNFSIAFITTTILVAACSAENGVGSSDDCSDSDAATGGSGGAPDAGGTGGDGGSTGSAGADAAETGSGNDGGADTGRDALTPLGAPDFLSNLPPNAFDVAGADDCVITEAGCLIDTDAGDIDCLSNAPAPYVYSQVMQSTGGINVGVFVCQTFRIEASASARVRGSLPLVIVALDSVQIAGELTANAAGEDAFGGGFSTERNFSRGGGPGGGAPGVDSDGSGAGGGGYCGAGGPGGVESTANSGGVPFGTPDLVPLVGGSGGGSGSLLAFGGAGGGAIQISAGGSISVELTGRIAAGGGAGGPGSGGSGGGGSGGAILLEAPTVSVAGVLAANGGSGGGGTNVTPGANATPDAVPAPGGGGGDGGDGSAGATIDGSGASITAAAGGGGAGRIRINTASGSATITGTLSPSEESDCVTQGTL